MSCLRYLFVALPCLLPFPSIVHAQDTRSVPEPRFPPVCATLHATLESTPDGPNLEPDVAIQDAESSAETQAINDPIGGASAPCQPGHAIELALGSDLGHNAFLINPITFPPGISLIIDAGVTVYASRNPTKYQIPTATEKCGTVGGTMITGVCQAVLTFLGDETTHQAKSGLYGYGVLDGQGQTLMLWPPSPTPPPATSWWGLLLQKKNEGGNVNENSPIMVSGGEPQNLFADDFTMYKVTIRNPPFHTVSWGGDGLTVWGVHIQAPWDEVNTDGFDLHGSNATVYDTTVSNGDDDIAFAINQTDTKNITVRHFSAYARDGITLLGDGNGKYSISNILLDDIAITADLPSVVPSTCNGATAGSVNGVGEKTLKKTYNVTGYAQALPNANGDVHGLNIKYQSASSQTNVIYNNICIQDIRTPLDIEAQDTPTAETKIANISFQNIHVLAPTSQYLNYNYGTGASDAPGTGRYILNFGGVPKSFYPQFTLSNVVFDDLPRQQGTPIASIVAEGTKIGVRKNVYPGVFNDLASAYVENPKKSAWENTNLSLTLSDNSYSTPPTPVSTPHGANSCERSLPFITGELFASKGDPLATGDATNLDSPITTAGSSISLNAVVQPIMSQTTYALPGATAELNVVAIASPRLSNAIRFYDGLSYVGSARLSANGTLASLQIEHLRAGWHVFSAQYPKDRFYATLNFGSVIVYASPSLPGHP